MINFFMISSFTAGIIALILPIINLMKINKTKMEKIVLFNSLSFSFCLISLFFQIMYNNYLVGLKDWASMMDTISISTLASLFLLIVIIALNFIVLFVCRSKSLKF